MDRKRSFLASKEWRTIPWTNIPKTPHQDMQDLLLELPGILEDQDTLPRAAYPSLLRQCLDLEARLKAWYENFRRIYPGPPYWLEFSTLKIDPPVFPTCYQFASVGVANTHTFYWANLILVYSTIVGLTPVNQPPIAAVGDTSDLAAQICMAMEYYISPGKKTYGPMLTLYPLRIAAECFKRLGVRGAKSTLWCKAVFGILDSKGIALGRMLEKLVWDTAGAERAWGFKGWGGRGFWERMEEGWIESAGVEEWGRRNIEEVGGGGGGDKI